MSRDNSGTHSETRSSALWGSGSRGGDTRANALWGRGGRGLVAILTVLFVTAIPLAGAGKNKGDNHGDHYVQQGNSTYVDPAVNDKVATGPNKLISVIIQSDNGFPKALKAFNTAQDQGNDDRSYLRTKLKLVDSVAVALPAKEIELLAKIPGLTISLDSRVKLSGSVVPTSDYVWPTAEALRPFYADNERYRATTPTIAIVDSGVEKNRSDFDNGTRVTGEQVITQLLPNSPGDGRGHGTFVAGIAAGSAQGYAGAAPAANIVSLDVMDDQGMARTSDVIAAAQWIYDNKDAKNIKVANFSLHSTMPSNFTKDPLDQAVEKLWFAGVTVVVAAGNYGNADGPSGVPFAPGNDPFVITVGALDLNGSVKISHHDVPSWSAYGYTHDGFRKPEIAAAGRFMVGPVSMNASLKLAKPANVLSPGYMRLSGTSFASPVVAGAAAQILARHPDFTPDQVKGALMQTARSVPNAPPGSAGVGEINAYRAASLNHPPNPNRALNKFLVPDPLGGKTPVFDAVSWTDVAKSSVSWDDASWSDASWSDVTWSDVTWSDVLAMADVTWEDAAEQETGTPTVPDTLSPADEAAALADPSLGLAADPAPSPPPLP